MPHSEKSMFLEGLLLHRDPLLMLVLLQLFLLDPEPVVVHLYEVFGLLILIVLPRLACVAIPREMERLKPGLLLPLESFRRYIKPVCGWLPDNKVSYVQHVAIISFLETFDSYDLVTSRNFLFEKIVSMVCFVLARAHFVLLYQDLTV